MLKTATFVLLASVTATTAMADEMSVNFVNKSDYAICEARVADRGSKLWSAELLGAPCLERGKSRTVRFDVGNACVIDWQFVLRDYPQNPVERLTFDACAYSEYVLDD